MPEDSKNVQDHPLVKSILLFSDGTGNSSAKLFKTNVWRLYEAVDLGPKESTEESPDEKHVQIAYYDNGVGTSSFRPLAILGGIFGFGLKRNVLNIYRYACRNYQRGRDQKPGPNETEGDHIYGFGFSRGAFTIRLAIAMIAKEGIVDYQDERDLARKSADAYRAFCADTHPRLLRFPTRAARWLRGRIIAGWRRLWRHEVYDRKKNFQPVIRFIGVWDTVAAYGGPFAEVTRAIDNWIWPLSMPDYKLSPRVRCARHALAIDDERDAFHPLLWDEVHERKLVAADKGKPKGDPARIDEKRLKQVWFAGMHSDVGGGYPDESLSYVSLLWMIGEAKGCGLRLLPEMVRRIDDLDNAFGPIHDSRAGPGAYYRYQPRRIDAYCHPVRPETRAMRDPAIRDEKGNEQGLLLQARIHESAIARIVSGTDNYAPINLPAVFEMVPSLAEGGTNTPPLVGAELRERLGVAEPGQKITRGRAERAEKRYERQEVIWDWVWARRVVYFLTLFLTIALVTMPLWVGDAPRAPFFTDGRAWIGGLLSGVGTVLPPFLRPLTDAWSSNPFYFLLLLLPILGLLRAGIRLERILRDHSRRLWWSMFESPDGKLHGASDSRLQRLRTHPGYQHFWQILKWHALPNLLGPVLLFLLLFGGVSAATQARLTFLERGEELCQSTPQGQLAPLLKHRIVDFRTDSLCHPTGAVVEEDARYAVTFNVTEPWSDGGRATDPTGARVNWRSAIGVPLRRVMTARSLQPLVEIRPERSARGVFPNVYIYPLALTEEGEDSNVFRAEFTAPRAGELMLFANDAVMPISLGENGEVIDYDHFYTRQRRSGNLGSACVTIERLDLTEDERQATNTIPACAQPTGKPKRLSLLRVP